MKFSRAAFHDDASGSDASVAVPASYLEDGPSVRTVRAQIEDKDGDFTEYTTEIAVLNVAPTVADAAFAITEHSPIGTVVGSVTGSDPGADTLVYRIAGDTVPEAIAIDPDTGQITVVDSAAIDRACQYSFAGVRS